MKIEEEEKWSSVAGAITIVTENIPSGDIAIHGQDLVIGMVVRDGRSTDPEAGPDLVRESRTKNEGHPDRDQKNLQADTEVDQSNFVKLFLITQS